ncbi:hypothetical protein H5410_010828 [Solanum commersonii]|uniref:Uncharacterized protein n=1 Tax=Solanum commersonii TaxID=4109 RepID=A0A9J6ANA1_SOLCO|nr:hypothetical protein H5410_010828 [Solanum commersonii]
MLYNDRKFVIKAEFLSIKYMFDKDFKHDASKLIFARFGYNFKEHKKSFIIIHHGRYFKSDPLYAKLRFITQSGDSFA